MYHQNMFMSLRLKASPMNFIMSLRLKASPMNLHKQLENRDL